MVHIYHLKIDKSCKLDINLIEYAVVDNKWYIIVNISYVGISCGVEVMCIR